MDPDGLKDVVKQGLVYFEREERDLHMLLFPEVLDQVPAFRCPRRRCASRLKERLSGQPCCYAATAQLF